MTVWIVNAVGCHGEEHWIAGVYSSRTAATMCAQRCLGTGRSKAHHASVEKWEIDHPGGTVQAVLAYDPD